MITVRPLTPEDRPWKLKTLEAGWGSTVVARLGEVIDAAELSGFVALDGGERRGLATYMARRDGLEVVTIQALVEGEGVGRGLMDRLHLHALEIGAPRLWLITTNDNIRAFDFYQRWGMDLRRVVTDGVTASRRVKPSIPELGANGIPLDHEIEFELRLDEHRTEKKHS